MRPRQFSDDDLLRVARECFLEHGASVPTAVIAARLGVSQAALFKRIGTKEALLTKALVGEFAPPWLGVLGRPPDERPPREQLLGIATEIDRTLRRLLPELSVLSGRGQGKARRLLSGGESPPRRAQNALAGWLRALARQRRARVHDPEALALVLLSALESRHIMRFALGLDYPDGGPGYVAFVVDVVWASIAAVEPTPDQPAAPRPAGARERMCAPEGSKGGRAKRKGKEGWR
jgi:AcrR family transcriptional regulator